MCSVTVMGLWPGFKDALLLSEVSIGVLVSTHYMKILCHKKLKFFIPDFSELLRSQLNFTYQLADLLQKSSVVQLNKFKPTENKPWRKDNSASFLFYWFLKTDPTINIFQLQTCSTANFCANIITIFRLLLATAFKANTRKLKSCMNQSSDKSAMKKLDMIQCIKSRELKKKSYALHSCID